MQSKPDSFVDWRRRGFRPGDRCRLAFSVADASELAGLASKVDATGFQATALAGLQDPNIFFCERIAARPRIAFLFPGQGSQYKDMGRKLVAECPTAKAVLTEIDGVMSAAGFPTLAELAWNSAETLNSDPWATQLSMLLADHLLDRVLAAPRHSARRGRGSQLWRIPGAGGCRRLEPGAGGACHTGPRQRGQGPGGRGGHDAFDQSLGRGGRAS